MSSTDFEQPCSCLMTPEHTVLRLTRFAEEPRSCDLLIDARQVVAVVEDEMNSEAQDGPVPVASLVLAGTKFKVTVFDGGDRGRYVQKYWLKALNLAVCKRGDAAE
jgi:hypothetical protein